MKDEDDRPWRSNTHYLNYLFILATITLDVVIIALAAYVTSVKVILSVNVTPWITRLPQIASVAGSAVASMNGYCVLLIANSWAKKKVLSHHGISLNSIRQASTIAEGSVPTQYPLLILFALSVLLSKAFVSSPLVGAVTSYQLLIPANISYPTTEFSSLTGTPNIRCEYGETYGYGEGCPMNNAFGVIYDAGLQAFTGQLPENLTREGLQYPSEFSGISGAISSLSHDASVLFSGNPNRPISSRDAVSACMPRLNVSTTCSPNLRPGYSVNVTSELTNLQQPAAITKFTLCKYSDCSSSNTAPDYTYGSIVVFDESDYDTGMTTVFIVSNGKYPGDLGSATIECNVTATEEWVPVLITAGTFLARDTTRTCPERPQPDPQWLSNITVISQRALQKQQGQDGRLEAVALVPSTVAADRIAALEYAIKRIVAVGATEAYALLDTTMKAARANGTTVSTVAFQQQIDYLTPRTRLGAPSSIYWVVAPAFLVLALAFGGVLWGFDSSGAMHFSPLDPISMAAAGMNSVETPRSVAENSSANSSALAKNTRHLRFRFGIIAPGRLGLSTRNSAEVPPPKINEIYNRADANVGHSAVTKDTDEVKTRGPSSSPMPSPALVSPYAVPYHNQGIDQYHQMGQYHQAGQYHQMGQYQPVSNGGHLEPYQQGVPYSY